MRQVYNLDKEFTGIDGVISVIETERLFEIKYYSKNCHSKLSYVHFKLDEDMKFYVYNDKTSRNMFLVNRWLTQNTIELLTLITRSKLRTESKRRLCIDKLTKLDLTLVKITK